MLQQLNNPKAAAMRLLFCLTRNHSTVVLHARVLMHNGKAAGVGLSVATTEVLVISGNIEDGRESRLLHITRKPPRLRASVVGRLGQAASVGPSAVTVSCRCALRS